MKNIKLFGFIAGAVVIVGGSVYFFNSGVVGGVNGLSRSKAAELIFADIKNQYQTMAVPEDMVGVSTKPSCGNQGVDSDLTMVYPFCSRLTALKNAGLVADIQSVNPEGFGYIFKTFDISSKGQAYIQSSYPNGSAILAEPSRVEVDALSIPSDNSAGKMVQAEYTLYYDITPFGSVLGAYATSSREANFQLFDNGWQVAY